MTVCNLITWLGVALYAAGVVLFVASGVTLIVGLLALLAILVIGGPAAAGAIGVAPILVGAVIAACALAFLMCVAAVGLLFFGQVICNPAGLGLFSGFMGGGGAGLPGPGVLACIARCLSGSKGGCDCGPGGGRGGLFPDPQDIFGALPPELRDALGFLMRQREELKRKKEAVDALISDTTGKAKERLEEVRDGIVEEGKRSEAALSSLLQQLPKGR